MEEKLYEAAMVGGAKEVEDILQTTPDINLQWLCTGFIGRSALHIACSNGHDSVVNLLLAHHAINVNAKNSLGEVAFCEAAVAGRTACVALLVKDGRAVITERNVDGFTPLCWAAFCGHLGVAKWILAAGEPEVEEVGEIVAAIGIARRKGKAPVLGLLRRFQEDMVATRSSLWGELEYGDNVAAGIFALVVFHCDGLLEIPESKGRISGSVRFFFMARKLPLELQMVLCYRLVGSMKNIVAGRDGEVAFRKLAGRLGRSET